MGVNKRQWLFNQIVAADSTKNTDDTFNGDLEELYHAMLNAGTLVQTKPHFHSSSDILDIASETPSGGTVITPDGSAKVTDSNRAIVSTSDIAFWGHSMAYSNNGVVESAIATYLGITAPYNMGVGGNTSTDIAIRMGGIIPLLTFTNGQIPADTSSAAVTVQPSGDYLNGGSGGNPFTYSGTVLGIAGTLTYATSTGLWTFARTAAGTATTVPANTPFLITSSTYQGSTCIIWPGRNNLYTNTADMTNVIRDVDAALGALKPYIKRFLVLADITSSNQTSSTTVTSDASIYAKTIANNKARSNKYGKFFYDLRTDFVKEGLSLSGIINPSASDLACVTGDAMPWVLAQTDGTHPNNTGYDTIGYLISRKLASMGWGYSLVRSNLLTLDQSDFETSNLGWSANGDTNISTSISTDKAFHGSQALKVVSSSAGGANVIINPSGVAVTPGNFYAASAVTIAGDSPRSRGIEFYWYNSSGSFLQYNAGTTVMDSLSNWTQISANGVVAPAGAAYLRVGVQTQNAGKNERHYIDAAGVWQVGSAGAIPPVWKP